eukprot:s4387_g1.t1
MQGASEGVVNTHALPATVSWGRPAKEALPEILTKLKCSRAFLMDASIMLQRAPLLGRHCALRCGALPPLTTARATLATLSDEKSIKASHPREYAVWKKLDRDFDGYLSHAEIRAMCRKFDATEHAGVLIRILDPDNQGQARSRMFGEQFSAVQMVRNSARLKHWHRTFGLGEILQRLENFPVTNAVIDFPRQGGNVQVEPEMGLYCDIVYTKDGRAVERLVPRRIAAFNDCSIRQLDGSSKLSEKKNWGFGSKGISLRSFRINSISRGSYVDQLCMASYIKRGDQTFDYSIPAPART